MTRSLRPALYSDYWLPNTQGERNPRARLTAEQVRLIRSLAGKKDNDEIAAEFGIASGYVRDIVARRAWRTVK